MERIYGSNKNIRGKLRDLAHISQYLKEKEGKSKSLKYFLQPQCVDGMIDMIKEMAGFRITDKGAYFEAPSTAERYARVLFDYGRFMCREGKKRGAADEAKRYKNFLETMIPESAVKITNLAKHSLQLKILNRSEVLPSTR